MMSKVLWDSSGKRYECDKPIWWDCREHKGLKETPPIKKLSKDQNKLLEEVIASASDTFTDSTGLKIQTHHSRDCKGENCSIHNPSSHKLDKARQVWDDENKLMQRVCEHGLKHPDFDDVKFNKDAKSNANYGKHNCDGCCGLVAQKYVVSTTDGLTLLVDEENLSEYLANSRNAGNALVTATQVLTVNELDEKLRNSGVIGKDDEVPEGYEIFTCECLDGDETWFYNGICTTCGSEAIDYIDD